ncbi:molybdenum cofactor biosynthesis protein MoaA [Desulfocucumis palustris]|uniref:Molybdenum cofactor biosynthesis protein MoaA n=2 Tax=Desulfocucumis palustris TaxID=1898651 RepID=A0A2L2XG03_9FIRM|nr:molybdenum cofactor biosynthesis protein MoaA [Desulfocucumis palustris]
MPREGVKPIPHQEILRNEEIGQIVKAGALVGINKIRLTGGEPLVRKGLQDLIGLIHETPGIDDIALTTNGILLPGMAAQLKSAGVNRLNISLDTLKPRRYEEVTRLGKFSQAWKGIETALELGFHPVKLNVVAIRGFNDDEILELTALSFKYPLHVRFIEVMPIGVSDAWASYRHIPVFEIKEIIEQGLGKLQEVRKLVGNGPAQYYRQDGMQGSVGFISPVSDHFCGRCNRLRLTAEGKLRPCLYSSNEIDLKTPLRNSAGEMELAKLFAQAIKIKPVRHNIAGGWQDKDRVMSQIGG